MERAHRDIYRKLDSFRENDRDWDQSLQKVVRSINSEACEATGFIPAYLFYGSFDYLSAIAGYDMSNKYYLQDLKLAKQISDSNKSDSDYKFKQVRIGTEIIVKPDPGKNGAINEGVIVEDSGGSTVKVKLKSSGQTFRYPKFMIYLKKDDEEYKRLFY